MPGKAFASLAAGKSCPGRVQHIILYHCSCVVVDYYYYYSPLRHHIGRCWKSWKTHKQCYCLAVFHLKKQVSTFCSIPYQFSPGLRAMQRSVQESCFFLDASHCCWWREEKKKKRKTIVVFYENDRNKKVAILIYYFNTKVYSYYNKKKRNHTS